MPREAGALVGGPAAKRLTGHARVGVGVVDRGLHDVGAVDFSGHVVGDLGARGVGQALQLLKEAGSARADER